MRSNNRTFLQIKQDQLFKYFPIDAMELQALFYNSKKKNSEKCHKKPSNVIKHAQPAPNIANLLSDPKTSTLKTQPEYPRKTPVFANLRHPGSINPHPHG